jgi:hypothetical protein
MIDFWRDGIGGAEKERTLRDMANHLSHASKRIQEQVISRCTDPVGLDLSKRLRAELEKANADRLEEIVIGRRGKRNSRKSKTNVGKEDKY